MNENIKKEYEPPTLKVSQVVTEGTIADSGRYKVELTDWETDTTPGGTYDGDIWLEF